MRRIGLYSDLHANVTALEAVLEDMARMDIAERYCLGDIVGYGPDPAETIRLVQATRDTVVRGNYDQGIAEGRGTCGCEYRNVEAQSDGEASYRFTLGAVSDADGAWLLERPETVRVEVAGVRIVLCHGSPRRINEYLMPDHPENQLLAMAWQANADVVCCGHVHIPYHLRVFDTSSESSFTAHYVNAGSVGKPKDGDARAAWVELLVGDADEVEAAAPDDRAAGSTGATDLWVGARTHRVAYDVDWVVNRMRSVGLPSTLALQLRSGGA